MTTHLRDARRSEGSAVTKGGVIRQIPVICAVDLITLPDYLAPAGSYDWYTDEPEVVDCDDCLARIESGTEYDLVPKRGSLYEAQRITTTHAGDTCERAIELLTELRDAHGFADEGRRDVWLAAVEVFLAEVQS